MFTQREDKFYLMLLESANNVKESAQLLRTSLDSLKDKEKNVVKIEKIEEKGDELVRTITKELDEAFITPIDREDIYQIIKFMDNILDLISSTMHRFIMFHIEETTEECKLLCDMLVNITKELVTLVEELKTNGCKSKNITKKINNVSKVESKADDLFRKTVAILFENESEVLNIIKWKEIYQIIENAIDGCEEIGNIIEGVVIKNA